ncbi:restriction endonuclease subunit S [Vibrio fluvialis]|nr:restriction endonuclease subunit S [Vibrio fluvialis]
MVPNGWLKTDLNDFIDIKHGFAFKSEYFREEGKYVLLTPGSFYEPGGFRDQKSKTKYYEGDIPEGYLLSKDDLLVAMTEQAAGLLGSTLFVPSSDRYLHNQRLGLIKVKDKNGICPEFIYLTYNASYVRKQIAEQSTGTKVKHTSPDKLKSVICLLPPLPEQQKIAKILSTWDKAITTTERLIATSQQQKKSLMQQLLTGKKRFVNPETGMVFEGDWEEVKLSLLATITMGSSPKSEAYNEIGEGLPLLQGNADIKSRRSAPRIYTSQITKECSIGDILLSVRAPVGSVAKSDHKACIGRGIASIKAKKSNSQEYLYQWLLAFEPKWERFSQGSTFEAVNSNDIKTLHILAPNLIEQQKIASVLTAADKEIELLEVKLAHLKEEKKALMQQLLTGKRRVKVDTTEAA